MDEAALVPEKFQAASSSEPLNWNLTAEEINTMSEEQLRKLFVDFNEKIRRLYEAQMLEIHRRSVGDDRPIKPEDIDHILNPEKIR